VVCALLVLVHVVSFPKPKDNFILYPKVSPVIRYFNLFINVYEFVSRRTWKELDPQKDITDANRSTGLTDFGKDMKMWWEGYFLLYNELKSQDFTPLGRLLVQQSMAYRLARRLKIVDYLKKNSEILSIPLSKPIFITGLPRTGSTLLFYLLCQDPQTKSPRNWETLMPVPSPEKGDCRNDPRLTSTRRMFLAQTYFVPDFNNIHPMDLSPTSKGYEEEIMIMVNNNLDWVRYMSYQLLEYQRWMETIDARSFYEIFKTELQILSWKDPAELHWTLKSPMHSLFIDALLHVFPDAIIVQTHRNLSKVVASHCSMSKSLAALGLNKMDLKATGEYILDINVKAMNKMMDVRDSLGERENQVFFDVFYEDLLRDPIGIVKKIYAHYGREVTQEFEFNMRRWLLENPQGKNGKHHYSLEEFGLTIEHVDEQFHRYIKRFSQS